MRNVIRCAARNGIIFVHGYQEKIHRLGEMIRIIFEMMLNCAFCVMHWWHVFILYVIVSINVFIIENEVSHQRWEVNGLCLEHIIASGLMIQRLQTLIAIEI